MGILNIRKAKRQGARLVIAFMGQSGTGKTLSALRFAWGLAGGVAERVGFLDTENGRGSLYADKLVDNEGNVHEFEIADLDAPFSPERFIQSIEEFQAHGVEVLVIDSVSAEWDGLGGCLHIAEHTGTPKMPNWIKAKREHKRFMQAMLCCDMHVIVCVRADPKVEVAKDANGKPVFIDKGLMPLQEKGFMYEVTASVHMADRGKRQTVIKCPEDLLPYLGREEGYIGPRDGLGVRRWVDGATGMSSAATTALNTLRGQTEHGAKHIQAEWKKLPKHIQDALGQASYDRLMSAAIAFDRQRADEEAARSGVREPDDATDELNAPTAATKPAATVAKPVVAEPDELNTPVVAEPPKPQPAIRPPVTQAERPPQTEQERQDLRPQGHFPDEKKPRAAQTPTLPPPVSRRQAAAATPAKPSPPTVDQIEAEIEGAFGPESTGPDGLPW